MTASSELPRLHLVTDDEVLRAPDFLAVAGAVLERHGPRVALHLRGHGLSGGEIYRLAERLVGIEAGTGAAVLVNDRVDVALTARADGVQLGRRSIPVGAARRLLGPDARLGYSAHAGDEAAAAVAAGADFVVLGTVYRSASHPDVPAAGVEAVAACAAGLDRPLVAIGGVTPARVPELLEAGAWGVAVLGGVWHAAEPAAAAGEYLEALTRGAG